MVQYISDQSGIVLRTLYVLHPRIARFGWTHAMLTSPGFVAAGYNFWKIPEVTSYPSSRFACERYLFRLESLFPDAFEATHISAFAEGISKQVERGFKAWAETIYFQLGSWLLWRGLDRGRQPSRTPVLADHQTHQPRDA
jgi:hypothetical protein